MHPRSQYRKGSTCGIITIFVALEERNSQAFSDERTRDLRRGATIEIRAIDTLVVMNVSNIGVVRGIRGPGGAPRRAAWSHRAEGETNSCASSHLAGISSEAGICSSWMSCKNTSIFPYLGVVWDNQGETNCWPHIMRMQGVGIYKHIMSGGSSTRCKVDRRLRCACVGTS